MATTYNWKFFRAGGFNQVVIGSGNDLLNLDQLDQKLWVALACPTTGVEFDKTTLALIDTDKDGRVRVPELIAAAKWAGGLMKNPDDLRLERSITIDGKTIKYHSIDTGAPHVVIEADALGQDLQDIDVNRFGAFLRHHSDFNPAGTNVNIIKKLGNNSIQIRTYERGVEAETLACGTGSVAAAIISSFVMRTISPVTVKVQSKIDLQVDFRKDADKVSDVYLTGPAAIVFTGMIDVSVS